MYPPGIWVGIAVLVCVSGLLIGCIGVGGVILVPVMLEMGIPVRTAIASSMAAYIAAGLVGTLSFLRKNSLDRSALWFGLGAAPGAFLGSFVLHSIGEVEAAVCTYILIIASAIFTFYQMYCDFHRSQQKPEGPGSIPIEPLQAVSDAAAAEQEEADDHKSRKGPFPRAERGLSEVPLSGGTEVDREGRSSGGGGGGELVAPGAGGPSSSTSLRCAGIAIGVFVGFGSAITGTSGPVIVLPLLFLLGLEPLRALGIAQSIQIPIATCATIGNAIFGGNNINLLLVVVLACGLVVCVPIGSQLAHSVPQRTLKLVVNVALLIAALSLVGRVAAASLAS